MFCQKRFIHFIVPIVLSMLLVSVCTVPPALAETNLYQGKPAKYVFFFIGDGMGIPQRTAAEQYVGKPLTIDGFSALPFRAASPVSNVSLGTGVPDR